MTSYIKVEIMRLEAKLAELREHEKQQIARPEIAKNPDFTEVINQCSDYVNAIANNGYADEDRKQWVFEAALIAVFGDRVFEWIRRMTR